MFLCELVGYRYESRSDTEYSALHLFSRRTHSVPSRCTCSSIDHQPLQVQQRPRSIPGADNRRDRVVPNVQLHHVTLSSPNLKASILVRHSDSLF